MKLVTVAEMQSIEHQAVSQGLTYEEMMENAGQGLANEILESLGYLGSDGVCGLIGSGNNGGDTLIALTWLAKEGWPTTAYLARPRRVDDPLIIDLQQHGGVILNLTGDHNLSHLSQMIAEHAILIDGVLGTGLQLPLKSELAELLGYVRNTIIELPEPLVVVAVDCPSGVDCDTGKAAPETIPADFTVTMAAFKRGLFKYPAANLTGELSLVSIGKPSQIESLDAWQAVTSFVPDANWIRKVMPSRPPDAHKGTFGTALIIAGSLNYTGAAWLAGQAAYRIGAGLVTLAVPESLHTPLAGQFPEATWLLLPEADGVIDEGAAEVVAEKLNTVSAVLIGPGLGLEERTSRFLQRLLAGKTPRAIGFQDQWALRDEFTALSYQLPPSVVDADGLKQLTHLSNWPDRLPGNCVLTPHPGEMSILSGIPIKDIQSNRLEVAKEFAIRWKHIVVLKGAFTVIANPDGEVAVIPVAHPALARAGTGDVLAGMIVGLLAQGVSPFNSAVAAAWIHAQGGIRAAENLGNSTSVLASDVLRGTVDVISEYLA